MWTHTGFIESIKFLEEITKRYGELKELPGQGVLWKAKSRIQYETTEENSWNFFFFFFFFCRVLKFLKRWIQLMPDEYFMNPEFMKILKLFLNSDTETGR